MRIGSEILLDLPFGDEEESLLDVRNLKNLVRHGEGLRLEFKMKVKYPEKIVKELVAFANTEGGHLFVGVSDAGVIEGVKFAEEEQFLLEYTGCVLLVSHDRYFMDKLVDHLFIFEGDGIIRDYPGNYTQYRILEKSKQSLSSVSSDITTQKEHPIQKLEEKSAPIVLDNASKPVVVKMSYKEKLEWETLNKDMPVLEIKKASLMEQMNQSDLDYDAITSLSKELSQITSQLEAAELRWLELSEKQ